MKTLKTYGFIAMVPSQTFVDKEEILIALQTYFERANETVRNIQIEALGKIDFDDEVKVPEDD